MDEKSKVSQQFHKVRYKSTKHDIKQLDGHVTHDDTAYVTQLNCDTSKEEVSFRVIRSEMYQCDFLCRYCC